MNTTVATNSKREVLKKPEKVEATADATPDSETGSTPDPTPIKVRKGRKGKALPSIADTAKEVNDGLGLWPNQKRQMDSAKRMHAFHVIAIAEMAAMVGKTPSEWTYEFAKQSILQSADHPVFKDIKEDLDAIMDYVARQEAETEHNWGLDLSDPKSVIPE